VLRLVRLRHAADRRLGHHRRRRREGVVVSWEQLLDIAREAEQCRRDEQTRQPTACPRDGTPLDSNPRGQRHCPFCGWIWGG
jgi:hypothetical protein